MLETKIADFFSKNSSLATQNKFAVAVSGGPDSMALAHMVMGWTKDNNKEVHIITVNHGLRPESVDEAKMVSDWAANQNITHQILNWEGDKPEAGIMEAARASRYDMMAEYCTQNDIGILFVAHHLDDQAETFLIRLAKGSGLDGLAAMNEQRRYNKGVIIIRPLLDIPKQDIISYCDKNKISYVQDPSNENEDYMRPRLRQSMAVLAQEGLTNKRLAMTAKRLARARKSLEILAAAAYGACVREEAPSHVIMDFAELRKQPEEIGFRVVQKALESLRAEESYNVRMEKFEELFESLWNTPNTFKPRTLGGCIFALKDKNTALYITKEQE